MLGTIKRTMPGAIAKNLKKADLAEDFGRLLIRSICAVAPISRADDFGIDTIATLLEIDEKSHLRELATSTFGIQFKAKSVREISFEKEHEANWLVNLEFPYFVGSVDLNTASMEIYTIAMLKSLPNFQDLTSIVLHLDDCKPIDDTFRISLDKPIITMNSADLTNEVKLAEIREILREWIKSEFTNIRQRKLGKTTFMSWETNKVPEINAHNKILVSGGENLTILEESKPYIDAALTELRLFSNDEDFDTEIESIVTKLATLGIFLETYVSFDFEEIKAKMKG